MQVSLTFFASFAKRGFYHVPKSVPGLPIEVQFVTKTVVVQVNNCEIVVNFFHISHNLT